VTAQRGWLRAAPVSVGLVVLVLLAGFVALCSARDDPAAPGGAAPPSGPAAPRAMTAADLAAMWTRYGDSPGTHWTGGDRTVSVGLPDGRIGWLFSDTFLGRVDADGSRPTNTPMIHNSLVVQTRAGLTATMHGGSPEFPKSLMCDDSVGLGCWIGDAIVDKEFLRVVVNHYEQTGPGLLDVRRTRTSLVTLTLPQLAMWEMRELPLGQAVAWGQSIVDEGGYTYVYGSEQTPDFNFVHLARVPVGGLQGSWQFWDGTGWSPQEAKSARLASGVGTSFSVDKVDGRYVLVSMEGHLTFNPAVVALTADAPTGPFADPVELFRAPEATDRRPVIVYDATLHPLLARPGKLLFSYNVNSLNRADAYSDAKLYRPRFVEVDWPPVALDPAHLPEPPQTLAARPDDDGQVHLSWTPPAGGAHDRFRVYQRDLTAGQIQWVRLPRQVTGTSTTLDLLKDKHRYEYRVTAEGPAGESQRSNAAAATARVAPPGPPIDFAAVAEGSGEVTLAWIAPRRSWWFVIEKRDVTAGQPFGRLDHPRAAASMLTAGGLTSGHEYEFRVRAMGGGGAGQWVTVRVLAWKGLPKPPADVTAAAQPGGVVKLTWTAPPGLVTYRVYQRDLTAGEQTFTERRPAPSGTTALVPNLTPGHEYEFVVTATNRAGESGRSFPARITIPPA
jgi:hypothetical protein